MSASEIPALRATLLYAGRAELAEGPVWHEGALWWVDIRAGTLNRYDPTTGKNTSRATGDFLGAAAPCVDGRWLLARRRNLALLDWESGNVTPLVDVSPGMAPTLRFNDGKCDSSGRFWIGTLDLANGADQCDLSVVGPDGSYRSVLRNVGMSNGLAWSPHGTEFFHIDTPSRRVDRFAFDARSGELSERRTLIEFSENDGWPDGMTCDAEGHLWVACWGGGSVWRIHAQTGERLARIALPVAQVSSCTFGGDGLKTLFITTAWQGLSDEQRAAELLGGSLFAAEPGVAGLPVARFAGPRI